MPGLQFAIPYNGEDDTLETCLAMPGTEGGNMVREVYLSGPQGLSGSGRISQDVTMEAFCATLDLIHAHGARADLTINTTCEGSDWYSSKVVGATMDYIGELVEDHGLETITIANPFYVAEAHRRYPDLEIAASVLSDIDCYSKAEVFARAGATTICPDVNVNKDLRLLKEMHDRLGVDIKLMVNEGCLSRCPYRKFHMNYISHRSRETVFEGGDFALSCAAITLSDPSQVLKSNWVRPEDCRRYADAGVTTFFKIVGRDMLASKVERCVAAYLAESYDGNLLDILCSNAGYFGITQSAYLDNAALGRTDHFEHTASCNRRCENCTYCHDLAGKLIRYGWVSRQQLEDVGEYGLIVAVEARMGGTYPVCPPSQMGTVPREIRDGEAGMAGGSAAASNGNMEKIHAAWPQGAQAAVARKEKEHV